MYFTFDRVYNQRWVLFNQLSTITPLPKAWDRTATGPANACGDLADVEAVYEFLMAEQGDICDERNLHRTRWAGSPIWSIVSGPWRLRSYTLEGIVTFVPNEHYSGPNKAYLDVFRQVPRSPMTSSTGCCRPARRLMAASGRLPTTQLRHRADQRPDRRRRQPAR